MRVINGCCLWAKMGIGGTAAAVGLTTAGGAAGAAILQAAGWTAGGAPILTLATVAAATAVGSSIVLGSLICCGSGIAVLSDRNIRLRSNAGGTVALGGGMLSSDAVVGAGSAALGAYILGATPLQVGYTAAAVGTGGGVFCAGFTVIGCALTCAGGFALCCKEEQNEPMPSRIRVPLRDRISFSARPASVPGEPINSEQPVSNVVYAVSLDADGRPNREAVPVYDSNRLQVTIPQLNALMKCVTEKLVQPQAPSTLSMK